MLSHLQRIMMLTLLITLTGCSVFGPVKSGPKNQYMIDKVPHVPVVRSAHQTLLVTAPVTLPAFNTTGMAYSTYPHQLAYFANNSWADTPANMLQALMVETLQKTHHYNAVVAPPYIGHYDLILHSELINLQQDFIQHPSVIRLVLNVHLVNANTNTVIASRLFTIEQAAPRNDPYSGVLAANRAAAEIMKKLAVFCEHR